MPKLFDKCIKEKGKIRTKKLSKNRYKRICILAGKTFPGETKKKKT